MSQDNAQVVEVVTGIKKKDRKLTQERVRELFDLDYETGVLTRIKYTNNRCGVGGVVGCLANNGYLVASIDCKLYLVHRIVFMHVHGYMPENDIDHINRNKLDNRPCNLRESTRSCNVRNVGLRVDNTSGVKGVYWHTQEGKWNPKAFFKGRGKSLGLFSSFIEAVAHRLAAEQCMEWEGCDCNSTAYLYMQKYLQESKCQKY